MANTKAGGQKAAATIKQRYGDDFYRRIGKRGGVVGWGTARGFAVHKDLAEEFGRKNGPKSKGRPYGRPRGAKNKPKPVVERANNKNTPREATEKKIWTSVPEL